MTGRDLRVRFTLPLAAVVAVALTGCASDKSSSSGAPAAKSGGDHPKADHPAGDHPKGDHPSRDHPGN